MNRRVLVTAGRRTAVRGPSRTRPLLTATLALACTLAGPGIREGAGPLSAQQTSPLEGRDGTPGWLRSSPDGPSDDLTAIRGLGPVMQERLNALGVFHFSQLAQMTDENASWIAARIHIVPGRLMHDRWAEQAQMLQSAAD